MGVVAAEATGEERERLWAGAVERYPQLIEVARKAAGRVIPLTVLTPVHQHSRRAAARKEQHEH